MKIGERITRSAFIGLVVVGTLGASRVAGAATFWVEAERVRGNVGGTITSPMVLKDDAAASNGSYIEVATGNDSKTSMPSTEGVTSYSFEVESSATFRVWARVIAANDGNDSFWVKMDNGSAIKWNEIPLGSSWHWVLVQAEGASSPATFSLGAGTHTLKIAYREDGTKLDALVITSDTSYNPNAAPTGAPDAPVCQEEIDSGTLTGNRLTWNAVPGAQSYIVEHAGVTVATGTGHVYLATAEGSYAVHAVASTGTSVGDCGAVFSSSALMLRRGISDMSVTSPLINNGGLLITQSGTSESLSAPPAHGRARFDFVVGGATQVRVWGRVGAPNVDNDSYWVRMDQGSWIRWNQFVNGACDDVHNSDAGMQTVIFGLSAGSHTLEFAYREVGATLSKLAITEDLDFDIPCDD